MKVVETEAIILKNYSLAEADKIIWCLTRENGMVRLSVRGAKRLKSRFGGSLEPFTVAEIVYGQKDEAELGNLFQAEVLSSYFHLAARLNVLQALSYLAEMLTAIAPPHEPNEVLFRMVRACLAAVDQEREDLAAVRLVVIYFELWLLRLAGFLPDFQTCGTCQTQLRDEAAYYNQNEARLICRECGSGQRREDPLAPNLLRALRRALTAPPQTFIQSVKKLNVSQTALETLTHRLLRRILEYDPSFWTADFELEANSTAEGDKLVA